MQSRLLLLVLAAALSAWSQEGTGVSQHSSKLKISFPTDSPVAVVSADWGDSRADARGGATVLDLHTSLILRNSSIKRVRGVTLLVQAQEVTPGGKASVAVPSLDIRPGETFPIRIDLRLLRPLFAAGGPLVQVQLDGVLFDDLSFYGPNRLNSRRLMTVWEMEARRDRRYFKSVLEAKGQDGLGREMQESLARQAERPSLDVQVVRRGRATALAASADSQRQFAFLNLPDSPVQPLSGSATVNGNEARAPRFEVLNRSHRPVHYFEIGWIVQDKEGKEFLAGSVPASDPGLRLGPGERGRVQEGALLKFSRQQPGQPVSIDRLTGFVTQVEFSDGSLWIPNRSSLGDARLRSILAPSAEEQRLTDLYRKKGIAAVVNELKRF